MHFFPDFSPKYYNIIHSTTKNQCKELGTFNTILKIFLKNIFKKLAKNVRVIDDQTIGFYGSLYDRPDFLKITLITTTIKLAIVIVEL